MHLDLQLMQQLKPADHCRRYVEGVLEQQVVNGNLRTKFSCDEAYFTLNGYINKQNYRIWGSGNPHIIEKRPLHSEKVTVWCAI